MKISASRERGSRVDLVNSRITPVCDVCMASRNRGAGEKRGAVLERFGRRKATSYELYTDPVVERRAASAAFAVSPTISRDTRR